MESDEPIITGKKTEYTMIRTDELGRLRFKKEQLELQMRDKDGPAHKLWLQLLLLLEKHGFDAEKDVVFDWLESRLGACLMPFPTPARVVKKDCGYVNPFRR